MGSAEDGSAGAPPRPHAPASQHAHPHDPADDGQPHDHDHDHDHHGHDHHGHDHQRGPRGWLRDVVRPHSHDSVDRVDDALAASEVGIRAVVLSMLALLLTAAAQAVIVVLTGSVALLSDTIHNLADALTAVPLWVAFRIGRRPANAMYTYGYGRAEDIAGVLIVAMIALSAVLAGYESIRRLLDPQLVAAPWVLIAAGLIGFAGNELVSAYRVRVGHRIGSAALVADGLHARTDGYTSLAVVVSGIGALAGLPIVDPIVGLVVTGAILVVLRQAARDIYRRLMDATDPRYVAQIEAVAAAVPGVRAVEEVRLRWIGHRMRAEIGIGADPALPLDAAHDLAHRTEDALVEHVPRLDEVHVHVGPAGLAGPP